MSYIAYMNGNLVDLSPSSPIAQTKQVNDLARLDNRQTNVTNTFSLPYTARNIRVMEKVSLVGNQSNLPYQRNVFDLVDAATGKHLIYKGWATIKKSEAKGYNVFVYDGLIDFYKAVENKSLTDIGVSDLNHLKNLTNVINSWAGTEPYMYILADYNGKNISTVPTPGAINIDYQLPSAKVSYIWDRVFDYAGHTYTGDIFLTEDFTNWFMTFPKPVPTLDPITTLVQTQTSAIIQDISQTPTPGGGIEYTFFYYASLFPTGFDNAYANNNTGLPLNIEQTGAYRISGDGSFHNNSGDSSIILWTVRNASNVIMSDGSFDSAVRDEIVTANAGDRLYIRSNLTGSSGSGLSNPLTGSMETTVELIEGYDANFDEVLIDFKATDFVNEVMQHLGLTMFKDKYTNNLDFRTLDEILQDENPDDWSEFYAGKTSEAYILNNYAQKNNLKYRYNDDNDKHNDGSIAINNVNLKDETTIISSKIYSPEKLPTSFFGRLSNTYKFWNKEVKDDGAVEYKELSGRYYFLKQQDFTFFAPQDIVSESLNTSDTITEAKVESYSRLKLQERVFDFYSSIESILDKAKVLDCTFYLKPDKIESFNFKRLIYVRQLASYYLVNKITNFIKGKPTKCEIIEVDYLKVLEAIIPPSGTYIVITNIAVDACEITITFDTDAILPTPIRVIGARDTFGGTPTDMDIVDIPVNPATNTIVLSVLDGGAWTFRLELSNGISSNNYFFNNFGTCVYTPPPPDLSYITITNINTYQVVNNFRKIRIDFTTDLVLPSSIDVECNAYLEFGIIAFVPPYTGSNYYMLIELVDKAANEFGLHNVQWLIKLKRLGIESNQVSSNA